MRASIPPLPQVVVLAAGHSSRLGQPKALVRIRGISLLRRTVRLTSPFSAALPIVVVPPRAAKYRRELNVGEARFVSNPWRDKGLSSSVIVGVRRGCHAPAILLLPVDLGCLTQGDLGRLVNQWRASRRRVAARCVEGHAGTPLILPSRLYAAALEIDGDRGLRTLIAGLPPKVVTLVDMPSAAFDVDTREDLAQARRGCRPAQKLQGYSRNA